MTPELQNLLTRLITDPSIPESVRRQIMEAILAEQRPSPVALAPGGLVSGVAGAQPPGLAARKLVYVHGICQHAARFSDPLWAALKPHLRGTFGEGELEQTRLEVVWSDLVNQASATLQAALAGATPIPTAMASEQARRQAAAEIREALRDRADQHALHAAARQDTLAAGVADPVAADTVSGMVSIPGLNCIDDFSIYLTSDSFRQQIIDRFTTVVGRELLAGTEVDIISHSWGTVVAYEGLRQLAANGQTERKVRTWFTVGSALSIGPVKMRLRDSNKDGRKPENTRRWVNLDARGDLVGGPLKDRPFKVDLDFVNLNPVGCGSFLGVVNPVCAHGSYFMDTNVAVNRDIFAKFINS